MRNICTESDIARMKGSATERSAVITDRVEVEVLPSPSPKTSVAQTYAMFGQWDWRRLRDYVVDQITRHHGAPSRDPMREASIFKGFINRWGSERAEQIARYVFERCDGRWAKEPVTLARFCKNADPFFATPISEKLEPVA